jgi:hypothetical protein
VLSGLCDGGRRDGRWDGNRRRVGQWASRRIRQSRPRRSTRRPLGPRGDVPTAVSRLSRARAPRTGVQSDHPGLARVHRPGVPRQRVRRARLRGDRLRLRRDPVPPDGGRRGAKPRTGDDAVDLTRHLGRVRLQRRRGRVRDRRAVLLGARDAGRDLPARPLDRDAIGQTRVGRARRTGRADARHGRARHRGRNRGGRGRRALGGRPRARPTRRERPRGRRRRGGRVERQRGDGHRRVETGREGARRRGDRRDVQ